MFSYWQHYTKLRHYVARRLDYLKSHDPKRYADKERRIRNRLISKKVVKLRREGYPESQAVAVAEDYFRRWSSPVRFRTIRGRRVPLR